ncbi:MAG: ligand-binding protein, partial [Spirochaetia bacterium]|nr:ligand-binding protein [Spirochaetia bacterium]
MKRVVLASLVLFLLATGARAQIFLSAEDAAGATADAASQGAAAGLSGSDTVDKAASSLDATVTSPAGRAALAMSTPDYPVTIGDVYSVVFLTAGGTVTIEAPVEADYRFALPNLAPLNLKGLTFPQFRDQAEKRVLAAYPGSSPRVYIKAVSVFQVFVKGEAKSSGVRYAWGLSRLSSLLGEGTAYASDRALAVVSADGTRRTYDLFKARRHGDLTQDPYLRPFDTVEFSRYERQVSIAGAVRRPGAYQLLPGEGVKELVEYYADGLTPVARPDLAVLSRRPDA